MKFPEVWPGIYNTPYGRLLFIGFMAGQYAASEGEFTLPDPEELVKNEVFLRDFYRFFRIMVEKGPHGDFDVEG